VSLRYFSVFGPRQRPDMAAHRFIEALLDNRPLKLFGDGRQVRDFTYVEDVVAATVRALFADLPPAAVLDVASGRPTAVSTLIGELRDLVGSTVAGLEQYDERPGDVPRTEGNITTARQHLDWSPGTDLRTGLMRQVAWHRGLRDGATSDEMAMGDGTLLPAAGGDR
jgi:UDP-glucuronate 4-epimerase